jgi:protein tyrosine phosphatase
MLSQSLDGVKIKDFQDSPNSKKRKRLSDEYRNISEMTELSETEIYEKCKTGKEYMNIVKNRYSNIVPFDTTRIRLLGLKNDYINANHIFIDDIDEIYIATQAPTPKTYRDFWKMVWDQQSSIIVMLTDIEESGKRKADQYWKDNEKPKEFSYLKNETSDKKEISISVTLIKKISLKAGILREFILNMNGETRKISHIQYTDWLDHMKPSSITDINCLIMYMDLFRTPGSRYVLGSPIIHCSAGVGRTGTFIACSLIKHLLLHKKNIYIPKIISVMRKCRRGMVQTEEQYAFIYKFLEILNI